MTRCFPLISYQVGIYFRYSSEFVVPDLSDDKALEILKKSDMPEGLAKRVLEDAGGNFNDLLCKRNSDLPVTDENIL